MAETQAPHLNSEQGARVLSEALGWMCELRGDIAVIRCGGHAMINPDAQEASASDVQFLQYVGVFPVIARGGGPQVNAMLDKLGIETPSREGVRITTPKATEIVRMVLTGQVQCRLVSHLNQRDNLAVGISGEDGTLFNTKCRTGVDERGKEIGFGLVGKVTSIDPSTVLELLDTGRIPVISSIAIDQDNAYQVLNANADAAVSALAIALGASKLLILTDAKGVYSNYPDPDSLLRHTTPSQPRALGDTISSGIVPKVQACLQMTEDGIGTAHVVDERQIHSVLIEVMTDEGTGTMVVPDSVEKDA